jgi:hypothetical protein
MTPAVKPVFAFGDDAVSDNGSNAVQALNAFRLSVQLIYGNSYRYPPSGRIIAYFRRDTASAAQYAARHFSNAT